MVEDWCTVAKAPAWCFFKEPEMALIEQGQLSQKGFYDVTGLFQGWGSSTRVEPEAQAKCASILVKRDSSADRGLKEIRQQLKIINPYHASCFLKRYTCQIPDYPQDTLSLRITYRQARDKFQDGLFVPLLTIKNEIFPWVTRKHSYYSWFGLGPKIKYEVQDVLSERMFSHGMAACEITCKELLSFVKYDYYPEMCQILDNLLGCFGTYALGLLEVKEDFCLSWQLASGNTTDLVPSHILCAIIASCETVL